jgi:hypothetical protein
MQLRETLQVSFYFFFFWYKRPKIQGDTCLHVKAYFSLIDHCGSNWSFIDMSFKLNFQLKYVSPDPPEFLKKNHAKNFNRYQISSFLDSTDIK